MNSPLILAPSCPFLWGQANQGQQRCWERKIRAQFYGVAEMAMLDLPQQLVILYPSFQKHKSQAWIIWIMHLQSLLVLRGLQKKSKGITVARKAGGCTPGAFGCKKSRGEPQPWSSTAQQTQELPTHLSSHLLRETPPHFPHRRMQAKQSLCHHHGDAAPTDSQGKESQAQHIPSTAVPCQPPSSAIHYSSQWHFSC